MRLVKITPFLWFNDNAEEAVNYYVDIFPGSEITQVTHAIEGMPNPPGSVLTIGFTLSGNELTALNGGPPFQFNEAVSLVVHCDTQEEIDYYWDKLLNGGSAMACGWLKDKYGLAWQIVPTPFFDWINSDDKEAAARTLQAMMQMVKFDIAALEAAYKNDK